MSTGYWSSPVPWIGWHKSYSNKEAVNLFPAKTVLCGKEPHPTRGGPVEAEQYGSRSEGW